MILHILSSPTADTLVLYCTVFFRAKILKENAKVEGWGLGPD